MPILSIQFNFSCCTVACLLHVSGYIDIHHDAPVHALDKHSTLELKTPQAGVASVRSRSPTNASQQ